MDEQQLTDRQRVGAAFAELRKQHGFRARQNFMCCQSCGWASMPDEAKAPNVLFYHKQDNEAFDADGNLRGTLYIAHRIGNATSQVAVLSALMKQGLFVNWDGSEDTRIAVRGESKGRWS